MTYTKHALIAHLDIDRLHDDREAVWQLIAVDLDVARMGVDAVLAAKAYQAADKFVMPDTVTVTPVAAEPKRADVKLAEEIGKWNHDLLLMLAARWPEGVAKPGAVRDGTATWSDLELEQVRIAIDDALPQLTADDITQPVPANPERFTVAEQPAPPATPPEDEPSDPVEVQAVLDAVASSGVRDVVNAWLHEAIAAEMSWHPRVYPTVGNLARSKAAIALASTDNPRDVLARVLGDDAALYPTVTVGTLIAALDLETAHHITNPNTSKEDK